jgi:hypothetical protein
MQASFKKFKAWQKDFLNRRPHRSFRLSRRRDYVKTLELPGYIAFTHFVNKTVWANKKVFLGLAVIYLVLFSILVGIGSQENYDALAAGLEETSESVTGGDFSQVGQAGLLFFTIATVGVTETPTEGQQILIILLGLLVWLTTVWLLRNRLAGHKVKLRDGLYNAGAPIIPLFLIALVILVQLLPILLTIIGYEAATATGLLTSGVEAMLFWFAAVFMGILSLYWITGSIFALIISTLPGMYPIKALRSSGDLVLGRRIRILLRWTWMFAVVALTWAVILIPLILIDQWLKSIWDAFAGVPVVPFALAVLATVSIIWISSYVYLLYRKVVDGSTK